MLNFWRISKPKFSHVPQEDGMTTDSAHFVMLGLNLFSKEIEQS